MAKPSLPNDIEWGARTTAWWKTLAAIPGADAWTPADWEYALDTALVHRAVWTDGDLSQLKELRMREQSMGISPAARPAKPTTEAITETITETPLQRITQRRVERRSIEGQSNAHIPAPPARRGKRKP